MKTKLLSALLPVLAFTFAGTAQAQALKTDDDRALYLVGYSVGLDFQPSAAEIEILKKGMSDAAKGNKPAVDQRKHLGHIETLARARANAFAEKSKAGAVKVKKEGAAFAEKVAKEKGAQKTGSGIIYVPQKEGQGASPTADDTVKVHYKGTLTDGTVFDSSHDRGKPVDFPLGRVIPCWTEGMQKMKAGGKAKLVCPSDTAYGDMGMPPQIPGGATLVFEVELLEVSRGSPAMQFPGGHGPGDGHGH